MKKRILTCVVFLFAAMSMKAQTTIMSEDFESVAMPTGWHQQASSSDPSNGGWKFGTNTALQSTYFVLGSPHTNFACVNDDKYNNAGTANKDTLYTSAYNLSTYSNVYLSFDYYYYQDGPRETATVIVSTDGGATWSALTTLTGNGGQDAWTDGAAFNMSAYAGMSNVMIAFTYDDHAQWEYGIAIDNVKLYVPNNYDLSVTSQNLPYYIQTNSSNTVSGALYNYGAANVTSMDLKYSVNGGAAVSTSLSSLSVAGLSSYNFTSGTPWVPTSSGMYTMKIWADNINGNADQNNANDTLTMVFDVIDSVQQKWPLFEEFNQASCDPCAQATPNLDSVLSNCQSFCNAIRYHVNWPGTDYMNSVTQSPFVGSRVSYYSVTGVPDAKLDGSADVYPGPGGVSTVMLANEASKGSPFKITLSANYNASTDTYSATVGVKAFSSIPAGYVLRAALTVDTITYATNQSTETIPQYVFPQVAEDMMPNANGTSLSAFTSGQTQTINLSWQKNHAWGAANLPYDSTSTHITVFVQDNSTKYIYQSATVVPTATTGIKTNSSVSYFGVYPNPTNDIANVAFGLKKSEHVLLNVYNMLGQKVISKDEGLMAQGSHSIQLNAASLNNGVYFVNFVTDNNTITKRIVVNK